MRAVRVTRPWLARVALGVFACCARFTRLGGWDVYVLGDAGVCVRVGRDGAVEAWRCDWKAMAAGAGTVRLGGGFALTAESLGEVDAVVSAVHSAIGGRPVAARLRARSVEVRWNRELGRPEALLELEHAARFTVAARRVGARLVGRIGGGFGGELVARWRWDRAKPASRRLLRAVWRALAALESGRGGAGALTGVGERGTGGVST